jgi:2'-5' RNA ligase
MIGDATSSNTLRTFIAVDPPPALQAAVAAEQARVQTLLDAAGLARALRWSPATNLHCTLRFLGDTTAAQVKRVTQALQALTHPMAAFDLTVGGLGAFPDARQPRVVWVGLGGDVAALTALQVQIEAAVQAAGFIAEPKPFAAHLTLARAAREIDRRTLQRVGDIIRQAAATTPAELGRFPVDQVFYYKSDLQRGGSVYTPLASMPLAAPA